jgi:hypothetical protein
MQKHLKPLFSLVLLTGLLILPYFVFAQSDAVQQTNTASQSMLGRLSSVAGKGGYAVGTNNSLMFVIGTIIQGALALLGGIFIIIMVIAGYMWMMASGNEQKVEKSLLMIKQAIIGLIITLSSWAIWTFILNYFILK